MNDMPCAWLPLWFGRVPCPRSYSLDGFCLRCCRAFPGSVLRRWVHGCTGCSGVGYTHHSLAGSAAHTHTMRGRSFHTAGLCFGLMDVTVIRFAWLDCCLVRDGFVCVADRHPDVTFLRAFMRGSSMPSQTPFCCGDKRDAALYSGCACLFHATHCAAIAALRRRALQNCRRCGALATRLRHCTGWLPARWRHAHTPLHHTTGMPLRTPPGGFGGDWTN